MFNYDPNQQLSLPTKGNKITLSTAAVNSKQTADYTEREKTDIGQSMQIRKKPFPSLTLSK